MKTIIAVFFLIMGSSVSRAGEAILPYSAFGPQVVSHELIGMEWWQWEAHGGSRPEGYPIKVVVFWDQTLKATAKNHPVDKAKEKDFRYVEYSKALAHMQTTIKRFKEAKIDVTQIEKALTELKKRKAEQDRAGQPATAPESTSKSKSKGERKPKTESEARSR